MRKLSTILAAVAITVTSFAQEAKVQVKNSNIEWVAEKVTGEHNGNIMLKDGTLEFKKGKLIGGDLTVDVTSMTCEDITDPGYNEKLIGHLKSADFFNTAEFSNAEIKFTNVKHKEGDNYLVTGDLTIKGITKPVSFDAVVLLEGKSVKLGAVLLVNRTEFDIKYGSASFFEGLGDKAIYDEFKLKVQVAATL